MADVYVSGTFPVPAAEMWTRIGDFQAFHTWYPGMASLQPAENGRVRQVVAVNGAQFTESLLEEGELAHRYRIDEGPLPVRDYVASLSVRGLDEHSCVVEWRAEFQPDGVPERDATRLITKLLQAGIDSLAG